MSRSAGHRSVRLRTRHVLVVLVLMCSMCTASAQPEVPPGIGPLPDPLKGAKSGAIVNTNHSALYRKLLPPEIAELLDVGEFQFEAMLQPREPERWTSPKPTSTDAFEVMTSGELRGVPHSGLRSQMFEVPSVPQGDMKQLAYKVLWNSTGTIAQMKLIAERIKVGIFHRADAAPYWLEFLVERIYPLALGESPGTEKPLFREKIAAIKPPALEKLSWLTLRFFGGGEDFVWAASPMINSIRQMTGSNRSDAIFSRIFAPDDLFVWSGKNELIDATAISVQQLLVPIFEGREASSERRESCVVKSFERDAEIQSNADSKRFPGAGAWVPTNTVMVLRNVWRVELSSRDPYTNDARQAVYVDVESGLPVYKIVWDQAGRATKVVMGLLRSVVSEERGSYAAWAGEYVIYPGDGARVALLVEEASQCDAAIKGREIRDFDPSSFVVFESSGGRAEASDKKPETRQTGSDVLD
mgnify:CR=1 FL=1